MENSVSISRPALSGFLAVWSGCRREHVPRSVHEEEAGGSW